MEVEAENEIPHDMLEELKKFKGQSIVLYENSGHKHKKSIYGIRTKSRSENSFKITMDSDGGIPLKRFVAGQDVEPSVSGVLETNCKCILFDFHRITVTK